MNAIDDRQIKTLISKQNEVALRYIIDEYTPLVRFIVKKYIAREEVIEECISDVFFNVWKNIDQFDYKRSSFKNWLAAISRYRAIDYCRKISREEICITEDITNTMYTEDNYEGIYDGLEDLLKGLNDEQKRIILMRFEQDLKPSEISRITGLNIKEVYNKIERSKKIIKKHNQKRRFEE